MGVRTCYWQKEKGTVSQQQVESVAYTTPSPLSPNTTVLTGNQSPSAASGSVGMTLAQVKNTWIQAGGNPQAADMAAAVADASSGLNPGSRYTNPDGTESVGLWLIPANGNPPGSTDPIANARAAVQLSKNGTDWSQWCVTWSDNNCGAEGGTYLGEGANALGSLGQTGAYNVPGAHATGNGTSASTVGSSTGTSTSTGSKSWLSIAVLILIVIAVFVMVRRKTGETTESQGRSQAPWSPAEEAGLSDSSKTDKQLSAETGRSIRAIRVRRNQLKTQ